MPTEIRTLLASAFELLNVAQGHPMRFSLDDGTEVEVRLPTADEAMEQQRASIETLRTQMPGWEGPPLMSREQAVKLATPLRLP